MPAHDDDDYIFPVRMLKPHSGYPLKPPNRFSRTSLVAPPRCCHAHLEWMQSLSPNVRFRPRSPTDPISHRMGDVTHEPPHVLTVPRPASSRQPLAKLVIDHTRSGPPSPSGLSSDDCAGGSPPAGLSPRLKRRSNVWAALTPAGKKRPCPAIAPNCRPSSPFKDRPGSPLGKRPGSPVYSPFSPSVPLHDLCALASNSLPAGGDVTPGQMSDIGEELDSSDQLLIASLGTDLAGRIDCVGRFPIGAGGYGQVYRGKLDGRFSVAIKWMWSPTCDMSRYMRRELEISIGLKHENILPLIGSCRLDGHPVLITPFMKFGDIWRYLSGNHHKVSGLSLILDVASGLAYLHSHNIVHADLKPSNVLVDKHHRACICDMGISHNPAEHLFTTPTALGSFPHMAPELLFLDIHGHGISEMKVTQASDVYSFGIMALEILIGRKLENRSRRGQFYITDQDDLKKREPRRCDYPQVPDQIWNILVDCWARNPASRPTIFWIRQQLAAISGNSAVGQISHGS
ncbi:unnamed protein product [Mycena citricolor]|uniref:Protein kinase domain-containing protein n=1 Tax=Mycena citricolor TaxID=2018698 RepID=A0AAD2H150_9AGAR|nr:unnamed protein product [Mycena citricolor]